MSKCDISIEFDNKERVFRGGDVIRGNVYVRVNRDVDCRGIILQSRWMTHGRGNRATGKYYSGTVYSGPLKAGDHHKYAFEIPAPHVPLSYRGKLVNIDHSLLARVDIPWAIDPKCVQDFVLLPAPTKPVAVHSTHANQTISHTSTIVGITIASLLLLFGLVLIPAFGFGLILMVIGAVVMFFSTRKMIAERKIGDVDVDYGEKITTSGRTVPVKVRFTPRAKGSINQITAKFVGREVCVSGSGSNRRTHRHVIYQDQCVLEGSKDFSYAEASEYVGEFTMPETQAYSFAASDNNITWSIEIHIDIPRWPDWKGTFPLTVVPPEHLDEPPVRDVLMAHAVHPDTSLNAELAAVPPVAVLEAQEIPAPTHDSEVEPEPDAEQPMVDEPNVEEPAVEKPVDEQPQAESQEVDDESEQTTEPTTDPIPQTSSVHQLHEQFESVRRFSDDAKNLIKENETEVFTLELVVDRVSTTIGAYDQPEFRNGKTVSGKLVDSNRSVSIEMPEEQNDELREVHAGDTWSATGRIIKWDDLFKRLEFRNAS